MPSIENIDVTENIVLMRITGSDFNEGNVVCIALDDRLVFVDAGRVVKQVKEFRSKMEKRFGKKTALLLLTHTHPDHYFGVDAFSDVPIVTTDSGVKAIQEKLEKGWSIEGRREEIDEVMSFFKEKGESIPEQFKNWEKELLETKILRPTIGVKDEISIGSNGVGLHYRAVGGHSDCSAYLFFEPDNVLITGDNLVAEHANNSPCMLAGFDNKGLEVLQIFEEINADKLIPGHGPVVDTDYVRRSREWFMEMFGKLRELKDKGVSAEEAIKDSSLPEFFEDKKPRNWDAILNQWYENV